MDKKPKARSAPAPKSDEPPVSIEDARRAGLRYHGPPAQLRAPGVERVIPARHLTPDETGYFVPDRATLRWLLAHGFTVADPPALKEDDHAD